MAVKFKLLSILMISSSILVYLADMLIAFMSVFTVFSYVHFLIALIAFSISSIMVCVTIRRPKSLMKKLEKDPTEFLFTFRGRYSMDVILSLILFGMGAFGFIFGCTTLILVFIIRILGVLRPDAFNDIFRVPPNDDETITTIGDYTAGDYESYVEPSAEKKNVEP